MPTKKKIKNLIAQFHAIKLANKMLINLKAQKKELLFQLNNLEHLIEAQYKALHKKERSMHTLFGKILNREGSQLENEQYLKSILKYNECVDTLELVEFEMKILVDKVASKRRLKLELDSVIKNEMEHFQKTYPKLAQKVQNIYKTNLRNLGLKKEIEEAISSGERARAEINKMLAFLRKAERTEIWGASYADTQRRKKIKYSLIDKAEVKGVASKQQLLKFEEELKDVYKMKGIKYISDFSEFGKFVEIYHNHLISDWVISRRLNTSITNVEAARDIINRHLRALRTSLKAAMKSIEKFEVMLDKSLSQKNLLK